MLVFPPQLRSIGFDQVKELIHTGGPQFSGFGSNPCPPYPAIVQLKPSDEAQGGRHLTKKRIRDDWNKLTLLTM